MSSSNQSIMVVSSLLEYASKVSGYQTELDDKIKSLKDSAEGMTSNSALIGTNIAAQVESTVANLQTIQAGFENNITKFVETLQKNVEERGIIDKEQSAILAESIDELI